MKKIKLSILTVLAVMALHSAYGQAELAIGVKGGLNFANVSTSSASAQYNSRTGYHVGAFVMFKFTKLAIQPELIYSQQGSTVKFNSTNFDSNFSYVNVPVVAKLYLVLGLNLQAGIQFGFVTSAKGPVQDINGNTSIQDVKSQLKGSDISIPLGVGWDLPFGLNIDGRYNLGVSDNNKNGNAGQIKNQVYQLSVGFKLIKLGK